MTLKTENQIKGRVKFITLGCRVNQYDTQAMRESMLASGYDQAGKDNRLGTEGVDVVVINTCTVTAEADKESRYWMRRAKKMYPEAKIVVTGCGVTRNRKEIESIPGVDLVIENHEKADLASLLDQGCASPGVQDDQTPQVSRRKKTEFTPLAISKSEGAGRAFVKIQDGCNHACSFCKVVLARGRSRSRPLTDILDEVKRLRDSGYREAVFAGIQLGAYGLDLAGQTRLADVLEQASKIDGIERLRLSSIEPTDVRPELIQALKSISKCVPHLHIPLQSGDTGVLRLMNRRYDREFYLDLIARLEAHLKGFALSLDVMAGFPSESEEAFLNTVDLLEKVRPVKTHVFPYSRREGTKAAVLKELPQEVVQERVGRLMELSDRLSEQYKTAYLGRVMMVLVESVRKKPFFQPDSTSQREVWVQGLTENFMKVTFRADESSISTLIPVRLDSLDGEYVVGKIAESF